MLINLITGEEVTVSSPPTQDYIWNTKLDQSLQPIEVQNYTLGKLMELQTTYPNEIGLENGEHSSRRTYNSWLVLLSEGLLEYKVINDFYTDINHKGHKSIKRYLITINKLS